MPSLNSKPYDFSSPNSFTHKLNPIDMNQAKLALRIFVDFIKSEIELQKSNNLDHAMVYEPMLSHLMAKKDHFLF